MPAYRRSRRRRYRRYGRGKVGDWFRKVGSSIKNFLQKTGAISKVAGFLGGPIGVPVSIAAGLAGYGRRRRRCGGRGMCGGGMPYIPMPTSYSVPRY